MATWRPIGALCALLLSSTAPAADAQSNNVRLGQIGIGFYAVTGSVIQEVLERLGHTVQVTQGSHSQIFPRLGAGEIDLLVVASKDWLARASQRTVTILRRIDLGLDAVAEMDYLVNKAGKTPREAARAWMADHPEVVDSWLAASD